MNENLLRICMRLYKEDHIGEDEFLEFIKELAKGEKGSGSIRSNLGSLSLDFTDPLISQSPITWKVGDILCDGSDNSIKC